VPGTQSYEPVSETSQTARLVGLEPDSSAYSGRSHPGQLIRPLRSRLRFGTASPETRAVVFEPLRRRVPAINRQRDDALLQGADLFDMADQQQRSGIQNPSEEDRGAGDPRDFN
jgi:hypothetical protein